MSSLPTVEEIEVELNRVNSKRSFQKTMRSTIAIIVVIVSISIIVSLLFVPVFKIYGTSMTPLLTPGEYVIGLKSKDFKQGDVVSFYYNNKLLVKRIIAVPGDWVNIDEEGNVFINGEYLKENYLNEKALGDCDISFPIQVPENKYFLMGDHRLTSIDSRNKSVGFISEEQIVAKLLYRIYPLEKLVL